MAIPFQKYLIGTVVCALVALSAGIVAHVSQLPIMLMALLIGLCCHRYYRSQAVIQGVDFCARSLLRFCVALLGVRIVFSDIVELGILPPVIVIVAMAVTLAFGFVFARLLSLPKELAALSSGAVAVCGVSAAAAISTTLPKNESHDKLFAVTVVGITCFSTLAMIFYPILVSYFNLSDTLAGVFIGGSIHDVAQVVGAAYSVAPESGDVATYIKLLRVTLLMPVVVLMFFLFKRQSPEANNNVTQFIPSFLILFFLLAFFNNINWLPQWFVELAKHSASYLLVVAIAAIGIKTSFSQILTVGWRPVVLIAGETFVLAAVIMAALLYFY